MLALYSPPELISFYHRKVIFFDVSSSTILKKILIKDAEDFSYPSHRPHHSRDEREQLAGEGQHLCAEAVCDRWIYAWPSVLSPHHLSAEPERSDVVHDLLAFLAEQMIELNKQRPEAGAGAGPVQMADSGGKVRSPSPRSLPRKSSMASWLATRPGHCASRRGAICG